MNQIVLKAKATCFKFSEKVQKDLLRYLVRNDEDISFIMQNCARFLL